MKGRATSPGIARANHYVPLGSLKRWSADGIHVSAYRLLVPAAGVPVWQRRPVRSVAYQRDLYTALRDGKEIDDFEKWLNTEYEAPGFRAIDKLLRRRGNLTSADWRKVALFVAAQDIRTPLNFIESMRRWAKEIPGMLNRVTRESSKRLEEARAQGVRVDSPLRRNAFSDLFNVAIERSGLVGSGQSTIRTEVTAGRRLWIASMRHLLLAGAAETLCQHRWSVAEPAGDAEWPLTDHPVLRLNFNSPAEYDFAGGWGHEGSEIVMPISPRDLLYVQVGKENAHRLVFSAYHTRLVQRLLIERAHRWVFATKPQPWVARVRPRTVDREMFAAEAREWATWHDEQSRSEQASSRSHSPAEQ